MTQSPLENQTAGCKSPRNWLVRLPMNLATYLVGYVKLKMVLINFITGLLWWRRIISPHFGSPPPLLPFLWKCLWFWYSYTEKVLKWWAIQLATHSTFDAYAMNSY